MILGTDELIGRLRANPLLRALRVGKLTLAALEATLRLWRDEVTAREAVPALAMIAASGDALKARAERLAEMLQQRVEKARIDLVDDTAEVGGGSYPGVELSSWVLRVTIAGRSEQELEAALRAGVPPVIARVREGALVLDPRTVLPDEEDDFLAAVSAALSAPAATD